MLIQKFSELHRWLSELASGFVCGSSVVCLWFVESSLLVAGTCVGGSTGLSNQNHQPRLVRRHTCSPVTRRSTRARQAQAAPGAHAGQSAPKTPSKRTTGLATGPRSVWAARRQVGREHCLVVVVVLHNKNPPTPCLWQAPASTQKTKRKTRPAIRRSARWRAKEGRPALGSQPEGSGGRAGQGGRAGPLTGGGRENCLSRNATKRHGLFFLRAISEIGCTYLNKKKVPLGVRPTEKSLSVLWRFTSFL